MVEVDGLRSEHWGLRTLSFCLIITSVQTKQMALTADYIRTSLQALYGESVTSGDVRAWCAMNGHGYQTVTSKLADCDTRIEGALAVLGADKIVEYWGNLTSSDLGGSAEFQRLGLPKSSAAIQNSIDVQGGPSTVNKATDEKVATEEKVNEEKAAAEQAEKERLELEAAQAQEKELQKIPAWVRRLYRTWRELEHAHPPHARDEAGVRQEDIVVDGRHVGT